MGRWKVNDRVAGFVQGGIEEGRGSFAKHIKVEVDLIWKIPEGISDEAAYTYGILAATAMQALYLHLRCLGMMKMENHRVSSKF